MRLDKYLKEHYGIPWTSLQICLRKKEIFVKDVQDLSKHKNPDYILKEGDIIRIPFSFVEKKTNGVSCQGGQDVSLNLVTMGQQYLINQTNQKYLVAHRLDKVTSGVLMVPKNQQIAKIYGNLFNDKSNINKYYIALVRNSPKNFKAMINAPIEYSQSKQRAIVSNIIDENSKSAHTHYQVLAQFKMEDKNLAAKIINSEHDYIKDWGDFSLLKIRIQEGRKHQIRVHLSEISKTPIVGDARYFDKNHQESLFQYNKDQSIFLHCYQTFINNQELCNRLSKNSSSQIACNNLGEVQVEEGVLKIQASFPQHFNNLFELGFKDQPEQLDKLKQMIKDITL